MTSHSSDHFKGKSVAAHLKEARTRGALASAEIHGTEMSGSIAAAADAAKECAILLLFIWMILKFTTTPHPTLFLILSAAGFLIWRTARSALLGWARMERLHRLIEEERWEIEHHRIQEKEELKELYAAKGLQGKLLDEVVEVMMADDNRLLQIMLEEELGLTLEVYEHPLKQAIGAACGAVCAALIIIGAFLIIPCGLLIGAALTIGAASLFTAIQERNKKTAAFVWNIAAASLASGTIYFLLQFFL